MNVKPHRGGTGFLLSAIAFGIIGIGLNLFFDQLYSPENFTQPNVASPITTRLVLSAVFIGPALLFAIVWLRGRRFDRMMYSAPLTLTRQQLDDALHQALGVAADDLPVNARGELTERQQAYIDSLRTSRYGCLAVVIVLVMFVGAMLIAATVYQQHATVSYGELLQNLLSSPYAWVVIIAVSVTIVLYVILAAISVVRSRRSFQDLSLKHVEGPIRLDEYWRRGYYGGATPLSYLYIHFANDRSSHPVTGAVMADLSARWFMTSGLIYLATLDSHRFSLTRSEFEGFWSGASYRIYYVQFGPTPIIMSAELLDLPAASA